MRQLQVTDYSSKEQDTGEQMQLALLDDNQPVSLDGDIAVIVANDDGAVQQLDYQLNSNKIIITPAAKLSAGRYRLEVWVTNGTSKAIYPSAGYLYFYVSHALTGKAGDDNLKVISVDDIYQNMRKIAQESAAINVGGHFKIDAAGNLIFSTNDNKE